MRTEITGAAQTASHDLLVTRAHILFETIPATQISRGRVVEAQDTKMMNELSKRVCLIPSAAAERMRLHPGRGGCVAG